MERKAANTASIPATKAEVQRKASVCRFCGAELRNLVLDLGMSPLANSNISAEQLSQAERFFPLRVFLCEECFLMQLEEFETPENIFTEYAYFSGFSESWLQHARDYTDMAVQRFGLNKNSQVIEVASNDGYLLQYFVEKGIPVLGIEPAANIAEVARKKNVPTQVNFFGEQTARQMASEGMSADLIIGNNVLAHVPRLNDFVRGLKIVLKPDGIVTLEFPHLLQLMQGNQFDTIYHEHFSYFSLTAALKLFSRHQLAIFDVDELPTHGGSLRIYVRHSGDGSGTVESRVMELKQREIAGGLDRASGYQEFSERVRETKRKLLEFLITVKRAGKSVVGYGAPAKGNTLLNYCGVRGDFIDYTVDRSPYKQGLFLPGTHIPVLAPEKILETRPDYLLLLPWNLKHEIMKQMASIREWGGQFIIPIPEVTVLP